MAPRLSAAQALEVARRLNPRVDRDIAFTHGGVVLHTSSERAAALGQSGSILLARRRGGVVVAELVVR